MPRLLLPTAIHDRPMEESSSADPLISAQLQQDLTQLARRVFHEARAAAEPDEGAPTACVQS